MFPELKIKILLPIGIEEGAEWIPDPLLMLQSREKSLPLPGIKPRLSTPKPVNISKVILAPPFTIGRGLEDEELFMMIH